LFTPLTRVPIHGQEFPAEQLQLAAQQNEFAEHQAEGFAVVAAEIGDGLEVGLQVPQQPTHLDIAMGLSFQPSAGADPVQVTAEACDREIKPINERVDEANRVLQAT
jgi:hypothetical protein